MQIVHGVPQALHRLVQVAHEPGQHVDLLGRVPRREENPLDGRLAVPPRYVHCNPASRACPRSADPAFWLTRSKTNVPLPGTPPGPLPRCACTTSAKDASMASGTQVQHGPPTVTLDREQGVRGALTVRSGPMAIGRVSLRAMALARPLTRCLAYRA